jgi:hypothetical protein
MRYLRVEGEKGEYVHRLQWRKVWIFMGSSEGSHENVKNL